MSSLKTTPDRVTAASASSSTTEDAFLGGRITLQQPRAGHRAGIDAVCLAAAVPAQSGDHALDAGAGIGTAGLCLLARAPEIVVTAVEIDASLCELAVTNGARNGFSMRFQVVNADVTKTAKLLPASLRRETYTQLLANPPFYAEGRVRPAPEAGRARAHIMPEKGLSAWVRFLAAMAAPHATLTLIHRAEEIGEILPLLEGRFGDVCIFPLFPRRDAPASRIILQGKKGSRAAPALLPGLVLHEANGRYTPEAEAVLRHGEPLQLRD